MQNSKEKYAIDKIAFLGLLIVALLIARSIVSSRHDRPLKNGNKIVRKIKNTGLNNLLNTQKKESFFLVKNAANQPIGFTMDLLVDSSTGAELPPPFDKMSKNTDQLNIFAASLFYMPVWFAREQTTLLQSNNQFDEFFWKKNVFTPNEKSSTETTLSKTGTMTVKKINKKTKEQIYQISPTAIPEVFLDLLFSQMLDSGYKKIIVDIIESGGTTTPAIIYRVETKHPRKNEQNDFYVLNIKLLDDRGITEQIYLDKQKQISKILLKQKNIYILERTSIEDVLKYFPEQADYILQNSSATEKDWL